MPENYPLPQPSLEQFPPANLPAMSEAVAAIPTSESIQLPQTIEEARLRIYIGDESKLKLAASRRVSIPHINSEIGY